MLVLLHNQPAAMHLPFPSADTRDPRALFTRMTPFCLTLSYAGWWAAGGEAKHGNIRQVVGYGRGRISVYLSPLAHSISLHPVDRPVRQTSKMSPAVAELFFIPIFDQSSITHSCGLWTPAARTCLRTNRIASHRGCALPPPPLFPRLWKRRFGPSPPLPSGWSV